MIGVVDRGFVSEDRLTTLQLAGGPCIVGERLRAGRPDLQTVLRRAGRYGRPSAR